MFIQSISFVSNTLSVIVHNKAIQFNLSYQLYSQMNKANLFVKNTPSGKEIVVGYVVLDAASVGYYIDGVEPLSKFGYAVDVFSMDKDWDATSKYDPVWGSVGLGDALKSLRQFAESIYESLVYMDSLRRIDMLREEYAGKEFNVTEMDTYSPYIGMVSHVFERHSILDIGKNHLIIICNVDLERDLIVGEKIRLKYLDGKGVLEVPNC